ncbi:type II secretion system F family protein [Mycobacterium vicinigordonae]|uniref:Type II secretion system F family protein n=1 Tax=Mycobacterium vicinigordonae TaxID=1719132 RepID=A0A7D6ILN7_9MYCO|nr:type II secretion system F family protein [Mycobacterium vicinigordonae]QLL07140.1 type II secretion system F family protein [Mycobacterium vicinigordonae]
MTGLPGAALMLALALLVSPGSPRGRLAAVGSARWRVVFGARAASWLSACALGVAMVVLPFPTAVATAAAGATVGVRCLRRRHSRNAAAEGRELEAALEVLVGELRVGAHPVRAFDVAADESGGPVSLAMRAVAARARLGADVAAGLRAAAQSSALPAQWGRLAVCWQLAGEHGLAISTLMRAAQRDIIERQRFSAKVIAGLAGARATAGILAALPLLGMLLGQLIGAQPLRFLFGGGAAGGWFLAVGVVLLCGGLLWSDRISDRVLSG